MEEKKCRIACTNFWVLLAFTSLAIIASVFTMQMQHMIEFSDEEENKKDWWNCFSVFVNAIAATILTQFFATVVEYIVKKENHGTDIDFEDSMINKSFTISCLISYGGLMLLAFWERSFMLVNLLMIFLIFFKQILLNLIEAGRPHRYYPKVFSTHKKKFKPHCRKFPNDYEQFSYRDQHYDAEKQLYMGEMPRERTDGFNELIIEFGWIVLFPPAFPIAALFAIGSNMIQYKTEKDGIKMFRKRGEPLSTMDIGKWLDYFELMSTIGIVNSALLIIFTSEKLTWFSEDMSWAELVTAVFIIENILIAFRFLLAAAIPDNPDWIEKEMFANKNRVRQVESEIDDKTIVELNTGKEKDFIERCLE